MPKRKFEAPDEFEKHMEGVDEIIFDVFENMTERPQGYDNQKVKYSEKKRARIQTSPFCCQTSEQKYIMSATSMTVAMLILDCSKRNFLPEWDGSEKRKLRLTSVFRALKNYMRPRKLLLVKKTKKIGRKPKT